MVNSSIVWQVDDLIISHVGPGVMTSVIKGLSKNYGETALLIINQGKVHEHLTIYWYIDGIIDGSPYIYIYKIASREYSVRMATPAPSNSYEI